MSDTIDRDFNGVPWQEDEKLAAARAGMGEVAKESGALIRDYPELDCSDGAHPAWWRGEKYGFDECVRAVANVLDGKDNGTGVASEPWEGVRRRLMALFDGAAKAKEMPTISEWIAANVRNFDNERFVWTCRTGFVNELPPNVYDELPVDVDGDKPGPEICTARYVELGHRDKALAEVLIRLGLARPDSIELALPAPTPVTPSQASAQLLPTVSEWREAKPRLIDSTDDLNSDRCKASDPETMAREITGPLIEAVRKDLKNIDVTPFKAPAPVSAAQPAPQPGTGDVWLEVIDLMHERRAVGIERYNTPLQHGNGRDVRRDAIDELLDALVYMRQRWVQEVEELKRKHGVIA